MMNSEGFKKGLDKAEKALDNLGKKSIEIGKKASAALTAAGVAAAGVIIKNSLDATSAQGKLKAQLGLTKQEADELGKVAKDVWKSGWGESIADVDSAIVSVRNNMGKMSPQDLEAMTKAALILGGTFDQDVSETTRVAGVMMKNFGITGQQSMDLLTAGFQRGANSSDDLLDTFTEYSPKFKALGLDAADSMNILIAGMSNGARNTDVLADAVKEFSIRAIDGSKTTADGYELVGLNADQMAAAIAQGGPTAKKAFQQTISALASIKDPVKQSLAGVALFGTKWEDVGPQAILAMGNAGDALGDFADATAKAGKDIQDNNPAMQLTAAMREMQTAIEPILKPIADLLTNVVIPAVKALVATFVALPAPVQNMLLGIAGLLVILGPICVGIGMFVSGLGALSGLLPILTGLLSVLGAAIAFVCSPIGLAVAAIALLAAGAYYVYKNWSTLGPMLSRSMSGITDKITGPFTRAKNAIMNTLNDIKAFIANFKWSAISLPSIKMPWSSDTPTTPGTAPTQPGIMDTLKNSVGWHAKGGVFTGPSLVGIGEQLGVNEAVVPLSGQYMKPFAQQIASLMGSNNSNRSTTIHHEVNLNNVPAGIDQADLKRGIMSALGSPEVRRELDIVNYKNRSSNVRPKGAFA
ncbi:MAG: hypothetical protein CVU90_02040 [Firmicutes bacterium HGW-Firmicutes-15]|nr:MAG: hypothetical protein CVU90_02040 [Firmicutes bacterium HGW-Firmicutes-15]